MLLYGIAAVAVLWFFLSNFAHANPASLAKLLKVIGGIVALGIAGLLAIRGRIDIALLIGSLGAWLLGWSRFALLNLGKRAHPASGSTSRVRSRLIEMTLDGVSARSVPIDDGVDGSRSRRCQDEPV